jgi:ribosomal protein S15P/S13E
MTPTEYRLAETLTRAVEDRLEEGFQAIEEQATALLREVATEVWRTSSRDVRPEQERIVTLLSRDQAIRSLIASSDERFQSLAVRTSRLEDHLEEVSRSSRETRAAMEASAVAIHEVASSPTLQGVETVRSQLEMVERHIAEAFAHMDERDELLTDTVLRQVRDHGQLIASETTRVVEAMQGYVQSGTEAMGHLAERIERHAEAFVAQDLSLESTIRGVVHEQAEDLTQQIDLVREKVGMHGRDQEALRARIEALLESRVRGLAELIRADSVSLRRLIDERMAALEIGGGGIDEAALIRSLDERLVAMEHVVEERMAALERTLGDQALALSTAITASVERNLERVTAAAGSVDGIDEMIAETQQAFEERMTSHIDDRMTAIAKLVRSDNQVLLGKLADRTDAPEAPIDADLLRQLIRSVKELQAGTSGDVMGAIDQRFQTMGDRIHRDSQLQAEAILKVAEVLGDKVDRLSIRVDEGVGNDIQVVVDRMSDAIRAMSSINRRDIA